MSKHRTIALADKPIVVLGGAVPLMSGKPRPATNVTRDLQLVREIETPTRRNRYYSQSQSEDLLVARYAPRMVGGVERMCLVGVDPIPTE